MVMIALINNLATTHLVRPQAARLICRLAAVLLDSGGVTTGEYDLISKTLQHLAVKGELPPAIKPKLITPQEAATMLGISYSQFRALEKEGAFPFKRKLPFNKCRCPSFPYIRTDTYLIHGICISLLGGIQ